MKLTRIFFALSLSLLLFSGCDLSDDDDDQTDEATGPLTVTVYNCNDNDGDPATGCTGRYVIQYAANGCITSYATYNSYAGTTGTVHAATTSKVGDVAASAFNLDADPEIEVQYDCTNTGGHRELTAIDNSSAAGYELHFANVYNANGLDKLKIFDGAADYPDSPDVTWKAVSAGGRIDKVYDSEAGVGDPAHLLFSATYANGLVLNRGAAIGGVGQFIYVVSGDTRVVADPFDWYYLDVSFSD